MYLQSPGYTGLFSPDCGYELFELPAARLVAPCYGEGLQRPCINYEINAPIVEAPPEEQSLLALTAFDHNPFARQYAESNHAKQKILYKDIFEFWIVTSMKIMKIE